MSQNGVAEIADGGTELVIHDIWIWDESRPTGRSGQTVVVHGDRIEAVHPAAGYTPPTGARLLNGKGLHLIPGLWDMHVHALWAEDIPAVFMPLLIVHGVTGIRDMGGTLGVLRSARAAMDRGDYPAPRVVAAGSILDGPRPVHPDVSIAIADSAQARQAARGVLAAGADFLKVYTLLPADAFLAIMEQAEARGVAVAGHVPASVGPIAAARAGLRSMEHTMNELDGYCPRDEPSACSPIFSAFREQGVWQAPVLAVERDFDPAVAARDPRLRLMPVSLLAYWFGEAVPRGDVPLPHYEGLWPEDYGPPAPIPEELWLTTALHGAGVPILAGTDAGVPPSLPGWSLHIELELLVDAGLSPVEALIAATSEPARYLNRENEFGTIAAGRVADLVLLRGNPLSDIRHTRSIEAVIAAGRLYGRAALDSLIAGIAADVARAAGEDGT